MFYFGGNSGVKKELLPTPENLRLPEIMARFSTEAAAIQYLELIRWPNGITCPHCGNSDQLRFWNLRSNPEKKIRVGIRQCAECKKQFRVTVGTIFEDSHIPLNLWIIAWHLLCGAKKGMSAKQLQRHLGLGSYKSAWFMAHRIRHAMQDPIFENKLGGTVEVDETYIGGKQRGSGSGFVGNKVAVVSLVERGGTKRSMVMDHVTAANLKSAIQEHVATSSTVCTDEAVKYKNMGKEFFHRTTNHKKKQYARKLNDKFTVHSNTVESSGHLWIGGVISRRVLAGKKRRFYLPSPASEGSGCSKRIVFGVFE